MTTPSSADQAPFHDLDAYIRLPRAAGLTMSPDGERLVVGVATVEEHKKQKYVTALWEVDPAGAEPARRLTRGRTGETSAAFSPDGDLLFSAARPGTEPDDEDTPAALWLLPRRGGEARIVGSRPGGLGSVVVARGSGVVVLSSPTMPTATSLEEETQARSTRKAAGVSAILHDGYPIRHWDHDLGPDRPRLLAGDLGDLANGSAGVADRRLELRDLTGHVGRAIGDESTWDVTADGSVAVVCWVVAEPEGSERSTVVAVDTTSGERRTLLDDPAYEYSDPRVSPDGTQLAALRMRRPTAENPPDVDVVVVSVQGGAERNVTAGWDRWPSTVHWTPDGTALVVTADSEGRRPVFLVGVADGTVRALTADDFSYTDPCVSPAGDWVYALRSSYACPPHPVRLALDAEAGPRVETLPSPAPEPALPGTLTEVSTTTDDGAPLRAWLALPEGASAEAPAPLLLWVHGGPLGSWNAWSWRWCPALLVARGYAVLLPDPALSTGYGMDHIRRGWGEWGGAPYTDLMAITDTALERDDLDAGRTAAMGGSFGGYMANWIAGHTDRFRAIVTHASLWALDQFGPTTDAAYFWHREMSPQAALDNSPHLHADDIVTPMLVVHGDKDYRVPIGEGIRLWYDLAVRSTDPDGQLPHRLLYFPDENHWVLSPGHAKVWYETVIAFLDQHVRGRDWKRPELLG